MDDVIHIFRKGISREAFGWLRRFFQPRFYSRFLQLVPTFSCLAFGFLWHQQQGVLLVQQDEKWLANPVASPLLTDGYPLYAGRQFDNQKSRVGILKGYLLRCLDCTNRPSAEVTLSLQRLVVAMIDAQHRPLDINLAVHLASQEALLSFSEVSAPLTWTPMQVRIFKAAYDGSYVVRAQHEEITRLVYGCGEVHG